MEQRSNVVYQEAEEHDISENIEEADPNEIINTLYQLRIAQLISLDSLEPGIPGYAPLLKEQIQIDLAEVQDQYQEWLEQNPVYKVHESK